MFPILPFLKSLALKPVGGQRKVDFHTWSRGRTATVAQGRALESELNKEGLRPGQLLRSKLQWAEEGVQLEEAV